MARETLNSTSLSSLTFLPKILKMKKMFNAKPYTVTYTVYSVTEF